MKRLLDLRIACIAVVSVLVCGSCGPPHAQRPSPAPAGAAPPPEKHQSIRGVRDDGPPHSDAACIVPGIYALSFDLAVAWSNEDRDDDRDCSEAPYLASPLFVRVEPFGHDLTVTLREPQAPYEDEGADSSVSRSGPCTAVVDLGDGSTSATLQLTFSGDEIAGTAATASYQIVEDGTEGENIWTCVGANVPISGHRVH